MRMQSTFEATDFNDSSCNTPTSNTPPNQPQWTLPAGGPNAHSTSQPTAPPTNSHTGSPYNNSPNHIALLQDLETYRTEYFRQSQDLEACYNELRLREEENQSLRRQLNMERVKFELLVDLWAMRVLDNEELGGYHSQQQQ